MWGDCISQAGRDWAAGAIWFMTSGPSVGQPAGCRGGWVVRVQPARTGSRTQAGEPDLPGSVGSDCGQTSLRQTFKI